MVPGGRQPAQRLPFLFGAKGASAGERIKQRHPSRCNKTKTSPTVGRRSPWSPGRRHHMAFGRRRPTLVRKCTICSPSKWTIVGALPAQYLGRGPGPLPINRTSHPQGRGNEKRNRQSESENRPTQKQAGIVSSSITHTHRERRVTELLLAVHRPSQEQTLARLFFLVFLIIISPRGNPPHHKLE